MPEKDFNQVFSQRLRYYLSLNNMTQVELAKKLGVGTTSVSDWVNGRKSPRTSKIDAMCELFGCSRSDLVEDPTVAVRGHLPRTGLPRTVKIYGRIAGGAPIEMIEDVIDEVDLSTIQVKPGQSYFGLRVAGHSMEPDIKDGDYIICLAEDDAESGSIVAVTVNGEDATCKRIMKYEDGIRLLPINPAYDVRYFTNEEITALPVRVLGVVVECRHRFM